MCLFTYASKAAKRNATEYPMIYKLPIMCVTQDSESKYSDCQGFSESREAWRNKDVSSANTTEPNKPKQCLISGGKWWDPRGE